MYYIYQKNISKLMNKKCKMRKDIDIYPLSIFYIFIYYLSIIYIYYIYQKHQQKRNNKKKYTYKEKR